MEMLQKFQLWFHLKILLWHSDRQLLFKQNEIWWVSLGMNLGEEMFGKGSGFSRPVLIFKKFTSNSFLGLPLTSKEKTGSWYVEISFHTTKSWVMLNQARVLDQKRLIKRIATLNDREVENVKKQFLELYGRD